MYKSDNIYFFVELSTICSYPSSDYELMATWDGRWDGVFNLRWKVADLFFFFFPLKLVNFVSEESWISFNGGQIRRQSSSLRQQGLLWARRHLTLRFGHGSLLPLTSNQNFHFENFLLPSLFKLKEMSFSISKWDSVVRTPFLRFSAKYIYIFFFWAC